MSTKQHAENRKQQLINILNEKKEAYNDIKSNTEFLLKSCQEVESKLSSLILGNKYYFEKYINKSHRIITILNSAMQPALEIDHNYSPIELFRDLSVIQLKEYIVP